MGRANLQIAPVVREVIESMGDGFPRCQAGPIMVIDGDGRLGVSLPGAVELTD